MLNRIAESYRKAPYFKETYELLEDCIMYGDRNLFNFIFYSLKTVLNFLNITTNIVISSTISINHQLKSDEKVMAICKERGAEIYINPIGGLEIYDKQIFLNNNLQLKFLKSNNITYSQFNYEFIPWLSIIDLLMFNNKEELQSNLESYTLY
jgi:hypothetical protein